MIKTKVLIVEDLNHVREQLRTVLELDERIEVVAEAANGQEALPLVEEYQPDTVLMDVQMPEMGGIQATQIIKNKWPKVKVILLTMYAEYQNDALDAGADAFLLKGSPTEDLLQAILNHKKPDRKEMH